MVVFSRYIDPSNDFVISVTAQVSIVSEPMIQPPGSQNILETQQQYSHICTYRDQWDICCLCSCTTHALPVYQASVFGNGLIIPWPFSAVWCMLLVSLEERDKKFQPIYLCSSRTFICPEPAFLSSEGSQRRASRGCTSLPHTRKTTSSMFDLIITIPTIELVSNFLLRKEECNNVYQQITCSCCFGAICILYYCSLLQQSHHVYHYSLIVH